MLTDSTIKLKLELALEIALLDSKVCLMSELRSVCLQRFELLNEVFQWKVSAAGYSGDDEQRSSSFRFLPSTVSKAKSFFITDHRSKIPNLQSIFTLQLSVLFRV